jgi:hypothetical protein
MQASVAAQVHPNALHPICEELSRDVVMTVENELGISLVDNER